MAQMPPGRKGAREAGVEARGRRSRAAVRAARNFCEAGFAGIKWDKWDSEGQGPACLQGRARSRWGRGRKSTVASSCRGSFVPPLHGAMLTRASRAVRRTMVRGVRGNERQSRCRAPHPDPLRRLFISLNRRVLAPRAWLTRLAALRGGEGVPGTRGGVPPPPMGEGNRGRWRSQR